MERTIVTCEGCSNVYTARVREGGGIVLPLDDQSCHCGSEAFDTVDSVGTEGIAP